MAWHGVTFLYIFYTEPDKLLVCTQQKWRALYFLCCTAINPAASFCRYVYVLLWSDPDASKGR
jgi:hypothetical protein